MERKILSECEPLLEERAYALYRKNYKKGTSDDEKASWNDIITEIDKSLKQKKCEIPYASEYFIRVGLEAPYLPRVKRMKIPVYSKEMADRIASEIALDTYFDPDFGFYSEVESPEESKRIREKGIATRKETKEWEARIEAIPNILKKLEEEIDKIAGAGAPFQETSQKLNTITRKMTELEREKINLEIKLNKRRW